MSIIVNLIWFVVKAFGKAILWGLIFLGLGIASINIFTIASTREIIYTPEELDTSLISESTPILILGAGVINNTHPSNILANRLNAAYTTHLKLPNNPIIVSGDHREETYNEVRVMKNYLVDLGVPSEQIYQDHAGHSTYDSIYRLKEVLGQDEVIIVTQRYHLYRAVMLAKGFDINTVGLSAKETVSSRWRREAREIFARVKDFAITYLGYQTSQPLEDYGFSFDESGDVTNNKDKL